ncbi:hypothetical protein [Kitasatospora sp. NPDC057198]|uniref:hypothetical protein n=1 Tax=Kitasatospora sp. NPDC057198 TaxID=3346046 RepID=UPI0036425511
MSSAVLAGGPSVHIVPVLRRRRAVRAGALLAVFAVGNLVRTERSPAVVLLSGVVGALAVWLVHRGRRLALVVDRRGVTLRRIGPDRWEPWARTGEPEAVEVPGRALTRRYRVVLPLRDGGSFPLYLRRSPRTGAEELRDLLASYRARALAAGPGAH